MIARLTLHCKKDENVKFVTLCLLCLVATLVLFLEVSLKIDLVNKGV